MPDKIEKSKQLKKMTFEGKVHRWVDGDTLDVVLDLGFSVSCRQRIRLADINAPERGHPNFTLVSNKAQEIAPVHSEITLICHGKDRYGRWVGDIEIHGNNVGQELLTLGLVAPFRQ